MTISVIKRGKKAGIIYYMFCILIFFSECVFEISWISFMVLQYLCFRICRRKYLSAFIRNFKILWKFVSYTSTFGLQLNWQRPSNTTFISECFTDPWSQLSYSPMVLSTTSFLCHLLEISPLLFCHLASLCGMPWPLAWDRTRQRLNL